MRADITTRRNARVASGRSYSVVNRRIEDQASERRDFSAGIWRFGLPTGLLQPSDMPEPVRLTSFPKAQTL